MEKNIQISVAQASFKNGDIPYNLSRMENMIKQCKKENPSARLIVFPELSATGYFLTSSLKEMAEDMNGSIFQFMSKVAGENNLYVVYGYVELDQSGQIYNSIKLIDPNGIALANYRKIHLTPLERDIFSPGSEIILADTEIGKIGLMICWDLAFPELARQLALQGANILVAPSAWENPFSSSFTTFGMARAIDNTVYVAATNHIGPSENLSFFGESAIYAPDGTVIASAKDGAEVIIAADLNDAWRKELKDTFYTMLQERRTDVY
ncbi:carbon-nitrogen hydrolase family protein [Bacillus sp. FJAT-29790]|uniref:carbon-nitrogen hydrolase family protein n=1 Tax=Bacillus sp. FJAT-29790 TaxID=1895002 RepID=UPI001C2488DE|nr:carbon-nitrogen hydrolase family protein [Bacillus sp. FJAT-29790]MBU8878272.1 carbon-nitrogen hydrolase family protein [Bacillus sp. FJAT-29790]